MEIKMLTLTQEKVDLYAAMSGDFNPIHVDPVFAKSTVFGHTIAHGTIGAAHMVRELALSLSPDETLRELEVKFIHPIRTEECLRVTWHCRASEPQVEIATEVPADQIKRILEIQCQTESGSLVAVGVAVVGTLPGSCT